MSLRRQWTLDELVTGVRGGDRRALARSITLIENGDALSFPLVAALYPHTGHAHAVGVTRPASANRP
jgi:LAO/AO transport system kinase